MEVGLTNKQTKIDPPPPLKENYMMNSDVEDEMKDIELKKFLLIHMEINY